MFTDGFKNACRFELQRYIQHISSKIFAKHNFKNGHLCPDRKCQVGKVRCISDQFAVVHGGFFKNASGARMYRKFMELFNA